MISKSKISQIRLLHQKKFREQENLFIVEGIKSCLELFQSKLEVIETFITENVMAKFSKYLEKISFQTISESEMEKISCLKTTPEILCIVKIPQYKPADFQKNLPIIVLDEIKDPGNLGTIIRTADWFGLDQIFCSKNCVEFSNPKAIQATMGSFTRVKIVYGEILTFLNQENNRICSGMLMDGDPIHQIKFNRNDIIVIGSESHGISQPVIEKLNQKIHIPHYISKSEVAESLNASVASGILLYELSKQLIINGQ
jgi:RNA methyltransferase, TrmH family